MIFTRIYTVTLFPISHHTTMKDTLHPLAYAGGFTEEYKANSLSFISNAMVLHNTEQMQNLNKKDRLRLGFDKKMPSHPTITETLKKVDPETLEVTLSVIVSKRISNFTQIAVDGKSIRGTSKTKEGLIHLMP